MFNYISLYKNLKLRASLLKKMQDRRLRQLIQYAYRHVPYYRKMFNKEGINPEDIKTASDLSCIPITGKNDFQNFDKNEFVSEMVDIDKCVKMTTSGDSGGIPFTLYLQRSEHIRLWKLILLRFMLTSGISIFHKCCVLAPPLRFPDSKKWFQYLGLLRHYYISADQPPRIAARKLIEYSPDAIFSYPGVVNLVASEIKKMKHSGLRIKTILTSGEMLDEQTRELAREAFGAEIYDLYGTVETGPIAWQCHKRKEYHINIDSVIAECIKSGISEPGTDRCGRIVCTSLLNYTMPLIRYDTGDTGVFSQNKCSCGCEFPLIKSLEGRLRNFIKLPDGSVLPPAMFIEIIKDAQYKFIQVGDKYILELLPGKNFSMRTLPALKNKMQNRLGPDADFHIKIVDRITKGSSLKRNLVVNDT